MSRRLMMAGRVGGGTIPTEGSVFFASFREGLTAETGQELDVRGDASLEFDAAIGREVMCLSSGAVTFPATGLSEGDQPFTVACKICLPHGPKDGFFAFGWGSTPWGPTVAGLACSSSGLGLRNWGALNIGSIYGTDWHHLAGTYDGSTARFYVDGNLNSSVEISRLTTGNETGSFGTWWTGDLTSCRYANARIYNRALLPGEVAALAKEL